MRCGWGRDLWAFPWRAVAAALAIVALFCWDGLHRAVIAQEAPDQHWEFSTGAEAWQHVWSVYSGVTVAPFGALTDDGLRLRATGGYGAFSYSGVRATGGGNQLVAFRGTASFGDLLVGYHRQLGPLTLKLYAGAMATQHLIDPADPEAEVQGTGIGAKGLVESWWTISEQAWASLDLSYGTLHESYYGRMRLGWRLMPALSAGLEAAAAGNADGDTGRAGLFVRYEWASGEISASGGLMTDWANIEKTDTSDGAFATISWMSRF